jgi:hypothetical protein
MVSGGTTTARDRQRADGAGISPARQGSHPLRLSSLVDGLRLARSPLAFYFSTPTCSFVVSLGLSSRCATPSFTHFLRVRVLAQQSFPPTQI